MNRNIAKLRESLLNAEEEVKGYRTLLDSAVKACNHKWSQPIYDPIRHEGYMIPGDPPGVGGSDHQLPCYVEPKTIKRWRRECSECGEVQYTSNVTTQVIEQPKF